MLKQKTPLKPGSKGLSRSTPMKRGTFQLTGRQPMARGAQLARQATPIRSRSKTNSNPRAGKSELLRLVRGQPCYLQLPGLFCSSLASVVPCHSNQGKHGKGMGIKADDEFTVPGCSACHRELDQGNRFTREEKFALWDAAYARWAPVRTQLQAAR